MKERVLLFQDGVKLAANPARWEEIDMLTKKLSNLCTRDGLEIAVIDPVNAAEKLFKQLNMRDFSCVIDLSGFFGDAIKNSFGVQATVAFHLSRLRLASFPRLDGSGFIMSLNENQIQQLKQMLDLKRPLLIDDVSWSGRTVEQTIRVLGLDTQTTTVGFLAVNDGNFGEGKPGAREVLERAGVNVVSGDSVLTPQDDGFHLADFFNMADVSDGFDVVLQIQKLRETREQNPDAEKRIKDLLTENRGLLFPSILTTEQIQIAQAEGRILSGGVPKNSFFTTNPPNWLMPSFSKRTRWSLLQKNRRDIVSVLQELKNITQEGRVVQDQEVAKTEIESGIIRGEERL